jgi:protein TonB
MRAHGTSLAATLLLFISQAALTSAASQTPAVPERFTSPVPIDDHAVTGADYPRDSLRSGEQGIVGVRFVVTETGDVSECNAAYQSGFPRLDQAACDVVARWKYKPATEDGKVSSAALNATIIFGPLFRGGVVPDQAAKPAFGSLTPDPGTSGGDPAFNIPERSPAPRGSPARASEPALASIEQVTIPLPDGYAPPLAINSHALVADDYPADSIRMFEQGMIGLQYLVTATGDVSECRVISSSGYPRLDAAACVLARRWKFKPAVLDGEATSTFVNANVVFQLR